MWDITLGDWVAQHQNLPPDPNTEFSEEWLSEQYDAIRAGEPVPWEYERTFEIDDLTE
jgi:hypothetical protein